MSKSKSLITLLKPNSVASESYKMLRSNLNYMNVDGDNQVILFTSSSAEEGKTTTVCNTAVELAKSGYKTLLIECDLRKARIHHIFEVPQSPGVTNILAQDEKLEHVVHKITGIENLGVITAGPLPPSPVELIESKKFTDMIEVAKSQYDKILIDAPPLLSVTDAVVISKVADGVIIIAAAEETRIEILKLAYKQLEKVNAKVFGVVLTKVNIKKNGYYYGYKSYYGNDDKKGLHKLFGKKRRRKGVDYLEEVTEVAAEVDRL